MTEPTPPPSDRPAAPGPHRPSGAINPGPVAYKGQPLEAERGPGLGCFRFQLVALAILIVATPLSVGRVPDIVAAILLFTTIGLLLVSGQTIIFLLRLVAADRRGRRAPLAGRSPTVGQLEDAEGGAADSSAQSTADDVRPDAAAAAQPDAADTDPAASATPSEDDPPPTGPVRQ